MELLTSVGTPRVHGSVTPRKIAERVKLGEPVAPGEPPMLGIKASEVLESFFRDIAPPRLESSSVLRNGLARGVTEGAFAYTSGSQPELGTDGKFHVSRDKVVVGRALAEDEVDFESGFVAEPATVQPIRSMSEKHRDGENSIAINADNFPSKTSSSIHSNPTSANGSAPRNTCQNQQPSMGSPNIYVWIAEGSIMGLVFQSSTHHPCLENRWNTPRFYKNFILNQ